ncbi:MAG: polyribonucleotide nucleotidyltransferase, partial [Pirellulales bacterium]|nr:polyribonucleotide nucleotidyltransferase [Pirellulales bacterium]
MNKKRVEYQIGNGTLIVETGHFGRQAAGCCTIRYGDTVVLSTAVSGPPRPGIDFFPLSCDYRERQAAAGKFPGGFRKREGAPTVKETLTARLIDRPLRPMFPAGYRDEIQVQNFVLASDRQTDGDVLAMNGSAIALGLSPLPFLGPLGSIRIGDADGQFIVFPTQNELEYSDLDLIVSGNRDVVLMIEGFAREMPEDRMAQAIKFAQEQIRVLCDLQQEIIELAGAKKMEFQPPEPNPFTLGLREQFSDRIREAKKIIGKKERAEAIEILRGEALLALVPEAAASGAEIDPQYIEAWTEVEREVVRQAILDGRRSEGRGMKTLRPIECEVDLLPSVHGSAMFVRGETQALVTVTLGTGRDEQRVDGLFEEYSKKFMLDYNFPPFSVGECRAIRGPGRREIGHGALAERSIKPILPDPDEFPYTIRVISDILESNGSSSMASVCAATLGLMASG